MSKQPPRRPAGKNRPQQRKGRTAVAAKSAKKQTDRTLLIVAGVVVVVGIALVVAFAGKSNNSTTLSPIKGDAAAPKSVESKVTGLTSTLFDKVGKGTASLPIKLPAGPPLKTADGKPRIVYLGAEYCPYCATERWGMVQALSRFGTFSNLRITTSAVTTPSGVPEVAPDTATFSFHNTKYTSKYIQFESVEQEDNSYKTLETPTPEQAALAAKYDAPPYVDAASKGSIPFIDFANQYLVSGASYDVGVLKDKTHAEIADAMADSSTDISKGAVGTANAITAAICTTTGDQPSAVCGVKAVKDIEAEIS